MSNHDNTIDKHTSKEDQKAYFSSVKIVSSYNNQKIVEIKTIVFPGKRRIDWKGVETYLKRYIGKSYTIAGTGQTVYIMSDFPDEYANSQYKEKSFGTIGKAKANLIQAIPELIQTVSELSYRTNMKNKHETDASGGWYYGVVHFSIPKTNDFKEIIGTNFFKGRMIIRCDKDGKLCLYDIIDIKKET